MSTKKRSTPIAAESEQPLRKRSAKSESDTTSEGVEIDDLEVTFEELINEKIRDTARKRLAEVVRKGGSCSQDKSSELGNQIESIMYKKFSCEHNRVESAHHYKQKYRSLLFNLKDPHNPLLRTRLLDGHITPKDIVNMSPWSLSPAAQKSADEQEKHHDAVQEILKNHQGDDNLPVKIYFVAVDNRLAKEFSEEFFDLPSVRVVHGDILSLQVDALVTPTSITGTMDGGLDHAVAEHFGWSFGEGSHSDPQYKELQTKNHVQLAIDAIHPDGRLSLGEAVAVKTDHADVPYLIAVATSKFGSSLPKNSDIPYRAARSVFEVIRSTFPSKDKEIKLPQRRKVIDDDDGKKVEARVVLPPLQTVAIPGLGTGSGELPFRSSVRQMRKAFLDVFGL